MQRYIYFCFIIKAQANDSWYWKPYKMKSDLKFATSQNVNSKNYDTYRARECEYSDMSFIIKWADGLHDNELLSNIMDINVITSRTPPS